LTGDSETIEIAVMRNRVMATFLLVTAISVVACRDDPTPRGNDTTQVPELLPVPDTLAEIPVPVPDIVVLGGSFLVPEDTPTRVSVVLPSATDKMLESETVDISSARRATYDLLLNGQIVGQRTLASAAPAVDSVAECTAWPRLGLDGASAGVWSLAVPSGSFRPLQTDSLSGRSRSDSLVLARAIARVASSAPGDTIAALHGTPFVVHRAFTWRLADTTIVLAEVVRSLNQEATPLQEHLLIVAESSPGARTSFRRVYLERSAGTEDMMESVELLAAGVETKSGKAQLVIARFVGDGVVYSVLRREDTNGWTLLWSSPYAGC
jgi:hypothetical protein